MDGLKRRYNEFAGTKLLLLFALGAIENKICGDKAFSIKVKKFFKGEYLINEIKKDIPLQLDTAWPNLLRIAKKEKETPLSLRVVSIYVFEEHNLFTRPECKVKAGRIRKINKKTMLIGTEDKKVLKINFLDHCHKDIAIGDWVSFHHNWLIGKKTPSGQNK